MITLDGTLGITSPAETVQGALTTTGNTILGDATTDTLTVGVTGIVKDASGNVGIGTASPAVKLDVYVAGADSKIRTQTASASGLAQIEFRNTQAGCQIGMPANVNAMNFITADTERMRIDSSGNLQFNSGYGSAATAYGCRAWVNFNGTGTVAIRASGNVSSITDGGVGIYTVNFTTAMVDANYCIVATGNYSSSSAWVATPSSATTPTTSGVTIRSADTGVFADLSYVNVSIFR